MTQNLMDFAFFVITYLFCATVGSRWRALPYSVPPSFLGGARSLVPCHRQFSMARASLFRATVGSRWRALPCSVPPSFLGGALSCFRLLFSLITYIKTRTSDSSGGEADVRVDYFTAQLFVLSLLFYDSPAVQVTGFLPFC